MAREKQKENKKLNDAAQTNWRTQWRKIGNKSKINSILTVYNDNHNGNKTKAERKGKCRLQNNKNCSSQTDNQQR